MERNKSLGQIAFEAWCIDRGFLDLWGDMPHSTQAAWEAAAQAVIAAFVALPKCGRCAGGGVVAEDIFAALDAGVIGPEVKCPACLGLGRDVNAAK